MWIICIKHHFHNPWGQRTQSLEFGRIGLSWKKPSMCGQEDLWWPSCEHRAEERWHQWQCANTQCPSVMVGQVQEVPHSQCGVGRSLWSHLVPASLGAFHINRSNHGKDWSEISTGTLPRGVLLTLTPVRPQTPSFWLLHLYLANAAFLLIILRTVVFWVISFRNKSAEASGIIFKQELPRSNPCWLNPTAEPIKNRHSLQTTKPSSEQGFRSSKTKFVWIAHFFPLSFCYELESFA